ncbi:MAG: hypothetical protein A2Z16_07505 [Chloroflexi bacterium RBG_16_54_18]|nr:MAG: hypothetical protein A2Z16_07505 [Chloroflexi bacterium RBG_16_54_18]
MEASLSLKVEGFWLPQDIRKRHPFPKLEFESQSHSSGRPCQPEDEGAVTAFWPRFNQEEWQELLVQLRNNRRRVPTGMEFWNRFRSALQSCDLQLADVSNPLRRRALDALPGYTGFSEPMIRSTLGAMELMSFEAFPSAFQSSPTLAAAHRWQPLNGLQGRIRFYARNPVMKYISIFPFLPGRPIFHDSDIPELVVGFGAGNVPGTALMIAMLSLANTLTGKTAPIALVRNSRQEPIFTPIVLEAIERTDPDLVCSIAVLVWDYEDTRLQETLLSQANLVVAAASDVTITQIKKQVQDCDQKSHVRFHPHGHKVSFAVIGREVLIPGLVDPSSQLEVLDIVALLAALDSVYWDQFGCLSARIHFVESIEESPGSSLDYARRLELQLRSLSEYLPRGSWPRQAIHQRFDRYRQLEITGKVRVFSRYEDDFLLVHDEREISPASFISQVNECQGRVIFVRPVENLEQIHQRYLGWIPSSQLQSLSVAVGQSGKGVNAQFLRFAEACGKRGVTAIRTVGRGAFPQLAYSWDGFLPLDMISSRMDGYFTTMEFDYPYDQTWKLLR